MISTRYIPQFEKVPGFLLFVPGGTQPGAPEQLTSHQDEHEEHHRRQQEVHYVEVHQREHVQCAMTPPVGLEQRGRIVRPFDRKDPVVPEGEPGDEEGRQGERRHLGSDGRGAEGPHLESSRVELIPQHPHHLDAPQTAPHDHVNRDVGLPGAVT